MNKVPTALALMACSILQLLLPASLAKPAPKAASQTAGQAGNQWTLYAGTVDKPHSTMSFTRKAYGYVLQDGELRNAGSDIDFCGYNPDSFTVGIEGGREGVIVDAGTIAEVAKSNSLVDPKVAFDQHNAFWQISIQNTKEVRWLNTPSLPPKSGAFAPVKQGHVYLIRIIDRSDPKIQVLAKLLVLQYQPGKAVTFRWGMLR